METLRFLMATTFYPPYHLGGDAVHVQYLAEALAARGHEVHVEFSPAAYRLKRRGPPGPVRSGEGVRIHAIPSPFGRLQPIAAYLLGRSRRVTRFHEALSRSVRPDVVHLHNISLLGLGAVKRPRDARMLYTAHDYWARCPRSDLLKYGRYPCEAPACVTCALASRRPPQMWRYGRRWRGLPGLDCAIAPSRFMARAIASALRCPVIHIPNFTPDANPLGETSDPDDYFLFVGVLEAHKGIPELIAAAPRLGSRRVKVVGSGSLARRLEVYRRQRGGPFEMEGRVSGERLHSLYRHANALLVPSIWHENAPLAAIEALSWGAPLLASRRGGLEELLSGGAAGRSFEPKAEQIVAAMEGFERDGLHRSLRSSARQAYEERHRPEAYLGRYLDIVRGPVGPPVEGAELHTTAEDPGSGAPRAATGG